MSNRPLLISPSPGYGRNIRTEWMPSNPTYGYIVDNVFSHSFNGFRHSDHRLEVGNNGESQIDEQTICTKKNTFFFMSRSS